MYWLAKAADRRARSVIQRFDPAFWTVNFPRPMKAMVTSMPDRLHVRCEFYQKHNLAGLIWESEDTIDHPLIAYETDRDYRGVTLKFRWQSDGVAPLDAIWGSTLTIEGRDQDGNPRTWFVRLWNYAAGTGTDAVVTLDFDSLNGGFILPEQADPVWAGDVDRMFFSLVPSDYDPASEDVLEQPVSASVILSDIDIGGHNAPLAIGDTVLPPHTLKIATGFDDAYPMTPARLVRTFRHLGYRDVVTLYVGMSHYLKLLNGPEGLKVDPSEPINPSAEHWFAAFFKETQAWGYETIASLSFELFSDYTPDAWTQRAFDGERALTGWEPPSTLLSPTRSDTVAYLADVMERFAELQEQASTPVSVQIGEPWWWSGFGASIKPCFYDDATQAAYVTETGKPVPTPHQTRFEIPDADQTAYLQWLGDKLGEATMAIRDRIKARWPSAPVALLFYTPQVLDEDAPMLKIANIPNAWAAPAFDRLQLEDYDHVIEAHWYDRSRGLETTLTQLGYQRASSDYFSGFILNGEDAHQWAYIDDAADRAIEEGYERVFIWAQPQVARDGYVRFDLANSEKDVIGFHDVQFPTRISFGSTGGPVYATDIIETASGHEQRTIRWSQARADYDVAPGLMSEADVRQLLAFYRARQGRAYAFRFKDWADWRSGPVDALPLPNDQPLGTGDGQQTAFPLIKRYGEAPDAYDRRIIKPVPGTVRVAVNGVELTAGFSVDMEEGQVIFTVPPDPGDVLTAGFDFDVPVRFADDRLAINLETFKAGGADSIPLMEVRLDRS